MNKKDLLFEDWKQCMENIRFFREQINKMSLWEFALLPSVGIAIALNFILVYNNLLNAGTTFIVLSVILGFVDNLTHLNARYSLIYIKIAQDLEKELGTSLSGRVYLKWNERLEEDKKHFFRRHIIFHVNNIKHIKVIFFILGVILMVAHFAGELLSLI